MLPVKILVLLAAFGCHALVEASNETTLCPPTTDDSRDGEDSLCPSFQDLRDIIDEIALMELIQAHYQCNAKFRKALCYYNSSRFHLVAQQLQQSEAYISMLADLRNAGVDTTDIESIVNIFACLELSLPKLKKSCDCKQLRGHTFVGDLLASMSHQAVHEYTAVARANHTNFGLFADTITSSAFQARMRTNMVSNWSITVCLADNPWLFTA